MRIGFDISQTGHGKAGCGHYAASLLQALLALDQTNEYLLYPRFGPAIRDSRPAFVPAESDNQRVRLLEPAKNRADLLDFWRKPAPKRDAGLGDPDVLHANSYFCPAPPTRAKLVYTLYDLSFVDHPEWTTPENWWNCLSGVMDAAFFADQIVTISDYSRQRFLDVFPFFPAQRIHLAPAASRLTREDISASAPPSGPNLAPGTFGTPGTFWLAVGTLEPRKNHVRLLKAYRAYLEGGGRSHPLILAGGRGWLTRELEEELQQPDLAPNVHLLGYVSDQDLAWLYANCLGFLYPSLDEGFGMPVLEAMGLGAAVITSNVAALPEVAGNAALLVDPLNVDELGRAMRRLAEDPALRRELGRKAAHQARKFSWDSTARAVLQVYAAAMSTQPRTAPVSPEQLRQWWSICSPHLRDRMRQVFEHWGQSEADREARLEVIQDLQSRLHDLETQRRSFQDRLEALEANLLIRVLRKLKIVRCGSG